MISTGAFVSTREMATCETADTPAFLDLPTLSPSFVNTSIPSLISLPRIKKTFTVPAAATAVNGTSFMHKDLKDGDKLRRGTAWFNPTAIAQEVVTAEA